ncbi:MAG: MmcQ/YjbR family DNA-binding protein [Rhizomicrobium sp.]
MATADDVRKLALALPGVMEFDHFARPAWRTTKRIFAVLRPDGLYLHLPDERKDFLFEADPVTFVKYMWGKRANVIVQIGRVKKKELEALIGEAYASCLPPAKAKLAKAKPAKKTPRLRSRR